MRTRTRGGWSVGTLGGWVLGWFLAWPAAGWGADVAQPVGVPGWTEHFVERFETPAGDRFRMFPVPIPGRTSSGGSLDHDAAGKAAVMSGWLQVVRPVKAGAHVVWDVELAFEPGAGVPPGEEAKGGGEGPRETALFLVLFNQTVVRVVIERPFMDGVATNRLRFERVLPGSTQAAREAAVDLVGKAPPDGRWRLEYRHGLMTVGVGTNRLGVVDFGLLGVQVAGVGWEQRGGKVRCSGMRLSGLPVRGFTAEEGRTLGEAGRLNELAQRLAREGGVEKQADKRGAKLAEAVATMREASALFVKVHGEEHHDAANSFANLASMLDLQGGRTAEAGDLWRKALAIHERVLGEAHPHTTLTRFNLGRHYDAAGSAALARKEWERCRRDWASVHGPEYGLVKSLDEILSGP